MTRPAPRGYMDASVLDYCAVQVRRYDRDRYLCAALAPPEARARLIALFAFNLEIARVREIAREPVIGQMRLQWWRDTIGEFAAGKIRNQPIVQALAAAFDGRRPRLELIERMLVGREFDLTDGPPADMAALESYIADTSSALLQLGLDLLDIADPTADEALREIGLAWALIGLARATPFHARQRRLFLPQAELDIANVTAEDVFEGRRRDGVRAVIARFVMRAEEHLIAARAVMPHVVRALFPLFAPAVLANRYRRRLISLGYDPYKTGVQAPSPFDTLALSIAAWRARY